MKNLKKIAIGIVFAVLTIALVAASLTSASDALESNSTLDNSVATEVPTSEDLTDDYCHDNNSRYNCGACLTDDNFDDCVPGNCHDDNGYYGCGGYGRHGGC